MELALLLLSAVGLAAGASLQEPFIHAEPRDQIAMESTAGRPAAVPYDRTPTARVPAPLADDTVVLHGDSKEAGPTAEYAAAGLVPYPAQMPYLAGVPTVLVLQPILVPLPEAEESNTRRQQLDYYGAADPRRRRPTSLYDLLRRIYF